MKVSLNPEIETKVQKALYELKEIGILLETELSSEVIDIRTMGGPKESLLNYKISFTGYVPDSFLEIKP
jgi:hypothetical protein